MECGEANITGRLNQWSTVGANIAGRGNNWSAVGANITGRGNSWSAMGANIAGQGTKSAWGTFPLSATSIIENVSVQEKKSVLRKSVQKILQFREHMCTYIHTWSVFFVLNSIATFSKNTFLYNMVATPQLF